MTSGLNESCIFDVSLLSLTLVSVSTVADDDNEDVHPAEDTRRNGLSLVVKCDAVLGGDVSNKILFDGDKAIDEYCLAEKTVGRLDGNDKHDDDDDKISGDDR
mmetsp:Transcript_41380/g.99107  ORF Transcript_41380/g.99107 Transcript_41380/m.99107 type:complete len:103 (+) Transcript_41380:2051-2359(+)